MLTEDYLMRMINQAIAALLKVAGLKKAGRNQEALEVIEQAFEQLLGLPASLVEQMDEAQRVLDDARIEYAKFNTNSPNESTSIHSGRVEGAEK